MSENCPENKVMSQF